MKCVEPQSSNDHINNKKESVTYEQTHTFGLFSFCQLPFYLGVRFDSLYLFTLPVFPDVHSTTGKVEKQGSTLQALCQTVTC